MSTPENILAQYRTYSYHHILIACDNDEAAKYIRETNNITAFRQLGSALAVILQDGHLKSVDAVNPATHKPDRLEIGRYVVILNGMIDTTYVVDKVSWTTATAASVNTSDRFTSIAVEGTMVIEEPRGVRFLNALNQACDLLQTDSTGVIWMLKTIFVGHTDKGETHHIVDLRPLEFTIADVVGTFTITGGVYEISFAGTSAGMARFPQFSRIAETITFSPPDNKLSTTMAELAARMNDKSEKNYGCIVGALQSAYPQVPAADFLKFRHVTYDIVLEDPYQDPKYVVDDWHENHLNETTGVGVWTFGDSCDVEMCIKSIMDRCSAVKAEYSKGDEKGILYNWQVHPVVSFRSNLNKEGTDVQSLDVKYYIRRHIQPTNQTVESVLRGTDSSSGAFDVTPNRIKQNLITFDYFFSGKGTDVIDFDIKMEMGLSFLQTLSTTNDIGTGTNQIKGLGPDNVIVISPQENAKQSGAANPGTAEARSAQVVIRPKTPIFPATNMKNILLQNVGHAHSTALYNALLTRQAALESAEVILKIHGNPYLMSNTNRHPSERERTAHTDLSTVDPKQLMENWDYIPALAKLHIFMPATNDTPSSLSRFDRESFWYQGYYYIYAIRHTFDGGLFTQELNMIALPNDSDLLKENKSDITLCGDVEAEARDITSSLLPNQAALKDVYKKIDGLTRDAATRAAHTGKYYENAKQEESATKTRTDLEKQAADLQKQIAKEIEDLHKLGYTQKTAPVSKEVRQAYGNGADRSKT